MDKIIIASTRKNAGKTSVIIGMAKTLGKSFGYLKPFGDRLFYRKKRLWDYDSSLMVNIFDLEGNPEDMSMAFEHAKARYMYDEETTKKELSRMISDIGNSKDLVFIEGGKDLMYGASVRLDAISLTRHVNGELLLVVSGDEGIIMDDLSFVKRYVNITDINFKGIIINKVQDIDDFEDTCLDSIKKMGIDVIGIIPQKPQLTYISVNNLIEHLFVKVIAGEEGLDSVVKNIFIGAMNADDAQLDPLFKKERKLIITSGDRSDMILAALESDTAGIILTNNIVPAPNIISKAAESNIPLLLVSENTFQVASIIGMMDPVLSKNETEKIDLLGKLVEEYVDTEKI